MCLDKPPPKVLKILLSFCIANPAAHPQIFGRTWDLEDREISQSARTSASRSAGAGTRKLNGSNVRFIC